MDRTRIKQIIEAILFVSEKPVTLHELLKFMEEAERSEIVDAIAELKQELEERQRGLRIVEVAGGLRFTTHPDTSEWLKRVYKKRFAERLSRACLETLAIIAYRQPLTRHDIEAVRGVSADAALGTLIEKRLIRISGRKETPGRPLLYGTSREFLEYFGLDSLKDLPRPGEVKNLIPANMVDAGASTTGTMAEAEENEDTGETEPAQETTEDAQPHAESAQEN
ncbi:MAG: SMC-Scp complex subunit ScpB [Candidatus Omnitrophica bacterium]|nr:SMC-Scp complex subunit ScpB [Candidatus Omnitrophota bacterium]